MNWVFSLFIVAIFHGDRGSTVATAPVGSVPMKVVNHAGRPIELFWVNTFVPTHDLVAQTTKPLRNDSVSSINSYNTHRFQVRFLDEAYSVAVADFIKGPRDETITVTYDRESDSMFTESRTSLHDLYDSISAAINERCHNIAGNDLAHCIVKDLETETYKKADTLAKLKTYRNLMSDRLRNYTCEDPRIAASVPVESYTMNLSTISVQVDMLLDTDAAKIWTVDNFVTEEECGLLKAHGGPLLKRATVAAEDGSSVISESRKANQASYDFYPDSNPTEDPLWPLFNRLIDVVNIHAGYNIGPEGQEYFTIIQYDQNDEYAPHCDGKCEGETYNNRGRVATAVLYCEVPEVGGATTFTKSDIFVRPKSGMATFFSYKGANGIMDDGYTEHSGCPVVSGEKWITTAWLREGVTYADPADWYDPEGKVLEQHEEEARNAQRNIDLQRRSGDYDDDEAFHSMGGEL